MAQTPAIAAASSRGAPRFEMTVTWARVIALLVVFAAWETLARSGLLYRDVVPSTFAVVGALYTELMDTTFYYDLWITFAEVAVGFVIGGLIGIAAGILCGSNRYLMGAVQPYVIAIGSAPKIIYLPIIFLIFGVGIESKMAKGALGGFFPTILSTMLGMFLINPVLIRVGRSFNLSRWQMVTKIYAPSMINPVITGLRLAMAIVVIGILVAEIKFADAGLGYRMINYYDMFRIAPMYATLIIIFILAALANLGMTRLQARLNRAQGSDESAATSLAIAAK